jgi:parallel beta-helix repeat protein
VAHRGVGPGRSGIVAWLLLLATVAPSARGATITVPTDRPTIQAAVDAATGGDVILVEAGTYAESVRIGRGRDGLTVAAADESDPPVLVPGLRRRDSALHVDRADDVTIDGLVIRDVFEGVRVTDALGVRLARLEIEDAGVAVRLLRAGLVQIDAVEIGGTRLGPGIRVDRSRDVLVTDVTVEATRREGVLMRDAPGAVLTRVFVADASTRDGIALRRSLDSLVAGCIASGNARDGIRVQGSSSITLRDNQADLNGNTGLRVDRSHPILSTDDLVAGGNHASANARRDMAVTPPRCGRRPCVRPATTTTGPATSTTSTTRTSTTTPASVPTSTPTTTSMTTTTGPLAAARWRLYVRVAYGSGFRDAPVPYRSIEAPLPVGIRPEHLDAFRVGDQVTADEIAALGGDTLARLVLGATAYISTHPNDYPGFAGSITLRWAQRAP